MPKIWEEMTSAEKIEALHTDDLRIFRELNAINHSLRALGLHLDQTTDDGKKAAAAVAALQVRLDSGEVTRQIEAELERGLRRAIDSP